MIRVITVAREFGAGGSPIAEKIAERLNWRIIDDPFIDRIAAAAKASPAAVKCCDESVDPWFHKILRSIWHGGFEGALSDAESEPVDADAVMNLWRHVIEEAAEEGSCVTVGRGGQCILKTRPDAFHVYLYAPVSERCERSGVSAAATVELDCRRSNFIRHYFDQDWRNPHLYDMMLCTSVGFDLAADLILQAAGLVPATQSSR
jgi:cytidylate kinase